MSKVFISGSIAIKKLPLEVIGSIKKIIDNNFEILVGDADGIDKLIQDYCLSENYTKFDSVFYFCYSKIQSIKSI